MLTLRGPATRANQAVAQFDQTVDGLAERLRGHPVADRVFYGASALGDHGLLWLLLGAARGLRSDTEAKAAIRLAVAMGAESAIVNLGIKSVFRRRRPVWAGDVARPRRLRTPRTSSFPSGHATAAFTAAALLSQDDPLRPLYYGMAAVVASSRVYVKVHHASDVIVGVGVGVVLGRLARRLYPLHEMER